MIRISSTILICLLLVYPFVTLAQNKLPVPPDASTWTADNGNGTFTNPLFFDEFSDPDMIRVGDDYYLTGTTMHAMPGLPVLHSRDLVNWDFLSYAVERLDLGTGVARFDIRGRRCAGAFLFVPETDLERAVPVKVRIRYGAQTGTSLLRIDFPTFNGVCLEGGTVLTPPGT